MPAIDSILAMLPQIAQWTAQGQKLEAIAGHIGISPGQLRRLAQNHVLLSDALGQPQWADRQVEEALYGIAIGQPITDCTYELRETPGGQKRMRLVKKVVKQREPDLAAVRMWLATRTDRWQDTASLSTADAATLLAEARKLIGEIEG